MTIRGKPVTQEQIQAWADEAEKGFPVEQLRKRGQRPVGDGPGEVVAVRMDDALLAQLSARAEREHVSRSEGERGSRGGWIDAASLRFAEAWSHRWIGPESGWPAAAHAWFGRIS